MASLIGRNLGVYEVRDVIGHGGMASVYLGYRADVDRQVAIKVLPPHPGMNAEAKQRFQLEARTIAKLQHPHILPLYDYGATEDDVLYLVMPFVRGGSLDRLIREGKVPVERAGRIVREISGALDYAHKHGVIHRDIKPANILLDGEGNALLADFGIVKLAGAESRLTGTSVVGTPAYMSPEQAQGFELSPRADMYSFAVVTFELLTGKLPFTSDSVMNLMLKHITDPVPDVTGMAPAVPRALNAVMKKQLSKEPEDRYASGAAFSEAFQVAAKPDWEDHRHAAYAEALDNTLKGDPAEAPNQIDMRTPNSEIGRSSRSTPIQIQIGKNTTPISFPIDPTDPNRPGTIVIQPQQQANNTPVFIAVAIVAVIAIAALVIVLIGSGSRPTPLDATQIAATNIALTPTRVAIVRPTFGRGSFSSSTEDAMGDSFNLRVEDFNTAPAGQAYVASLLNTATGDRLPLGRLNVDAIGSGALGFVDADGRFLPTLYNAITITLEDDPAAPTFEDVRYSSMLPAEINGVMHEIFVESPENGFRSRSLLQTAELDARFATQHAGLAAGARNMGARHTHNEHTLNILLGGKQDFDGSRRGNNPGTGLGLLPMLDRIDDMIGTVADTPDAPTSVQIEAELVRVCLQNVRLWSDEVITYEQSMLLAETLEDSEQDAQESSLIAQRLQPGLDENENDIVEPFEGECGLDQVTTFGLVIASFDIFEGDFSAVVSEPAADATPPADASE